MTEVTQKRDFYWSQEEEPHKPRQKQILKAHPEIKKLINQKEWRTCPLVLASTLVQILVAAWVRDQSWGIFFVVMYAFGGTINHSLLLASHELSHNLCFKKAWMNKCLAITANLVTGVPSACTFQRYHMEHHQFQGVDEWDTDIPTMLEVVAFGNNTFCKFLFVILQSLFYALRPSIVKPMGITTWEVVNWIVQMSFNAAVVHYLGWWALFYMVIGSLLGMGLHPAAGHFIAEHYVFHKDEKGNPIETYSYYGPVNYISYNVGYHNEHHDFPKVAWSNLPKVRAMAPEFYDNIPSYNSYCKVIYNYITDPSVGPFSRVKRKMDVNTNAKKKSM